MDIFHHVGFNSKSSQELVDELIKLGIKYKSTPYPGRKNELITFDIYESDTNWGHIFQLLKTYQEFELYEPGDFYETVFSEDDIRNAEWLRLISNFEQGYPQPKMRWPLEQLSLSNVCPTCAIHTQTNSMRIAKEPYLRNISFMSLFGVAEIFATPEVFSAFRENNFKGYEAWDVMIHKTNTPSERVRQLYVPQIARPGLIGAEQMGHVKCKTCGTIKYYYHRKGVMYLKRSSIDTYTDFIKTNEWFGSGYVAYHEILISNRVAQLILDMAWKGVHLKVVELI